MVGVDTSAGGGDYSAAQFLSKTHLDVPVVIHSLQTITAITPHIKTELDKVFDDTKVKPVVAYERQNGGVFELERLGRLNREGKYKIFEMPDFGKTGGKKPKKKKIGWDTNTATRPIMLQAEKEAIDGEVLTIYHKKTVNELFSFIISKTGKPQAEEHAFDDLVIALGIAWQLYQLCNPPQRIRQEELPKYEAKDKVIGV